MTAVPRLITGRRASALTRMPWDELRSLLEEAGATIYQFGRRRYRVAEDDLAELLRRHRVLTPAQTRQRADLLEELAAAEVLGPGTTRN